MTVDAPAEIVQMQPASSCAIMRHHAQNVSKEPSLWHILQCDAEEYGGDEQVDAG